MSNQGHCNCESIKVELAPELQKDTLSCFCSNCQRAGGLFAPNYVVDEDKAKITDSNGTLKTFTATAQSGNKVERSFCGDCGSPVVTRTPKYPGKAIIKASLFDQIAAPAAESFTQRRPEWQKPVDGAQQL
ncbi:Mss4-like protein [Fusarium flagelliforme]|uniref:Mss4-like protein n=1 Tax=Fusarium flagelliforme TaxID=2675880 RepID=UPI001E8D0409|nr:Mss4-like protein [Fusarium flagelliforme]KAH7188108.1 Mss4-like protein [Fusarium flagelliforme]